MKTIAIIWVILYTSTTFAANNTNPTTNVNSSPQISALNIMQDTLSSLKKLKSSNKINAENVKILLLETKLLSDTGVRTATEMSLRKHWGELSTSQKTIFQQYIVQSLIKDYSSVFTSYDKLDKIHISIDPKVKRQDNRAIIKLVIRVNEIDKPVILTLKMIQTDRWHIYDVVFSGVSLIKNYQAQFNSHIRRKGLESLIAEVSTKI